ncbi:MAG TPA: hypothetical protein VNO55_05275 [Polyangia bacterium]|nr:hypothetical protein [Polyangia bacterium]
MNKIEKTFFRAAHAVALAGLASAACSHATATLERPGSGLVIQSSTLFPETIEYDARRGKFLLGSFREGAIYQVNADGTTSVVVSDPRLCSVLGIAVDPGRQRVWAVNADLGASTKPSAAGPKKLATVGVYDLVTGTPLGYFDLAPLLAGPHLLNGIALDGAGNAYVSDSFSPALYRIDTDGHARVFLRSDRFTGKGVNLNGVVVHPDGYLLVIKKSDGVLFKVPLAHPEQFSAVQIGQPLVGGDGLLLAGAQSMVVVANKTPDTASNAAFVLSSTDGWQSARLVGQQPLGDVYPTTAVLRDGRIYAVSSKLNQLLLAPADQQQELRVQATIRFIGKVTR